MGHWLAEKLAGRQFTVKTQHVKTTFPRYHFVAVNRPSNYRCIVEKVLSNNLIVTLSKPYQPIVTAFGVLDLASLLDSLS